MYSFAHNSLRWRSFSRADRACRIGHTTIQISFGSLDDLKVMWVLLWCDQVMADQEIDQNQSAIRFELSIVQCFDDFGEW